MKSTRTMLLAAMALMFALSLWGDNHPWLTHVYEYRPAPGQFINTMPIARVGEPVDSVLSRCKARICGRIDTVTQFYQGEYVTKIDTTFGGGMISLGGFGGYVVVGFDHPVVNMHDYDFEIWGNAFVSDQDSAGGSCEPGIVMVGVDCDGDGVPSDADKWYELAGSEYYNPKTQHDYTITYYRPDEAKPRTPSAVNPDLIDTTYIHWTSNDVNPDSVSGYMSRNLYHMQPYWPLWLQGEETMTFSGTKLPNNAVLTKYDDGNYYYTLCFLDWGYVDNLPNFKPLFPDEIHNPGFKIDWAVDEQGKHVSLTHIDFIKVYNAMNQYCGSIGETSTEVTGGIDYHPDAVYGDVNGDKEVNISDVNTVIAVILAIADSPLADVNGDGEVNISDINTLIDVILH